LQFSGKLYTTGTGNPARNLACWAACAAPTAIVTAFYNTQANVYRQLNSTCSLAYQESIGSTVQVPDFFSVEYSNGFFF
jgi:hypothetical protein